MSSQIITNPAYYTSEMSYAEWKRDVTTAQVLFGLHLPYRPPPSLIGRFLWRRRVWVEVTFALSMLEPWEKFLVMVVMYLTLGLLLTGVWLYLPEHMSAMSARAAYYLFGDVTNGASDTLSLLKAVASSSLTSLSTVTGFRSMSGEL